MLNFADVVPHRSTNRARTCLTSLSRREAVLSCWYGRSCLSRDYIPYNKCKCKAKHTHRITTNTLSIHLTINYSLQKAFCATTQTKHTNKKYYSCTTHNQMTKGNNKACFQSWLLDKPIPNMYAQRHCYCTNRKKNWEYIQKRCSYVQRNKLRTWEKWGCKKTHNLWLTMSPRDFAHNAMQLKTIQGRSNHIKSKSCKGHLVLCVLVKVLDKKKEQQAAQVLPKMFPSTLTYKVNYPWSGLADSLDPQRLISLSMTQHDNIHCIHEKEVDRNSTWANYQN